MKGEYRGYCLSWETKYSFGKPLPVPQKVYFSTRAMSLEEATLLLSKKASKLGYGLGGVQGVELVKRLQFDATVVIPGKDPMHYGNHSVARDDVLAWFRIEKPDVVPEITRKGPVTHITAEDISVMIVQHPPKPVEAPAQ